MNESKLSYPFSITRNLGTRFLYLIIWTSSDLDIFPLFLSYDYLIKWYSFSSYKIPPDYKLEEGHSEVLAHYCHFQQSFLYIGSCVVSIIDLGTQHFQPCLTLQVQAKRILLLGYFANRADRSNAKKYFSFLYDYALKHTRAVYVRLLVYSSWL